MHRRIALVFVMAIAGTHTRASIAPALMTMARASMARAADDSEL
jgi:hypothetical protein